MDLQAFVFEELDDEELELSSEEYDGTWDAIAARAGERVNEDEARLIAEIWS